jgi:hypothetical protein
MKLDAPNMKPKERIKLTNQSLVYEVFGDDEKLTIAEITSRTNEKLEGHQKLSDQTVRRAVKDLCASGLLKPFGKSYNSQTYGKLSASFSAPEDEKLIPFAGEMVSVQDFMRTMTDPDLRPFTLKTPLIGEKRQHAIRRMMLYPIIMSNTSGVGENLKAVSAELYGVIDELEFMLASLRSFVNSPIWYEQYRDRMARSLRVVAEKDPELFQLTVNYVRNKE